MKSTISQTLRAILVATGLGLVATSASAHTISLGTFNAGAPGSVTIALGTYDHSGSEPAEGFISLTAGPSAPLGPIAFGNRTVVKPVGLIDGTNNFYASNVSPFTQGLYNNPTNTTGLAAIAWQTATFTGLAAGVYTYQITGMNTVNWSDWNSDNNNWTGTLTITGSVVTGNAPDGGSTFALMGLSLLGLAALRRKA